MTPCGWGDVKFHALRPQTALLCWYQPVRNELHSSDPFEDLADWHSVTSSDSTLRCAWTDMVLQGRGQWTILHLEMWARWIISERENCLAVLWLRSLIEIGWFHSHSNRKTTTFFKRSCQVQRWIHVVQNDFSCKLIDLFSLMKSYLYSTRSKSSSTVGFAEVKRIVLFLLYIYIYIYIYIYKYISSMSKLVVQDKVHSTCLYRTTFEFIWRKQAVKKTQVLVSSVWLDFSLRFSIKARETSIRYTAQ